jgi:SAM-dependent methyltransferase
LSGDAQASPPSAWLLTWREALEQAAARGPLLDLACGLGRNTLAAASWGVPVVGLDRNAAFLRQLAQRARGAQLPVSGLRFDLEQGHGIPVAPGTCGAILVFRFLFRPLAPAIEETLAPGGLLLYETFTLDQRKLGYGPSRKEFLLTPSELPTLFPGLAVEASWEGIERAGPRPEAIARLAARKRPASAIPARPAVFRGGGRR